MNYVPGSADPSGGVYNASTKTLSWTKTVAGGDWESLTFAVTATTVESPTLVINTATIAADDDSFERPVPVLLVPEPADDDTTPPEVHDLIIDEQDVLTDPAVTLHISATDNVSVEWMYLREWQLDTTPFPHWQVAQSSGWVDYQADYAWTLGSESGVHFVGVWVADGAYNVSMLHRAGLDYASLLLPGETVPRWGMVPYLVHYEAGVSVNATLTPATGDADLYVWYPDSFGWPDEKSTKSGTAPDTVSFTTPDEGTYLFLVHGYRESTYDLTITPAGGPHAWSTAGTPVTATGQLASLKPDELTAEPLLSQSGLDPLAQAVAPDGPFVIYMPAVTNQTSFWPTN